MRFCVCVCVCVQHDSTLLNLLCAIGFYDCNFATAAALDFHFVIPPFSSAVLVELVKPADEDTPAAANTSAESSYSIRFSYKPGNVDERIPIAIPGERFYCTARWHIYALYCTLHTFTFTTVGRVQHIT